MAHLASFHSNRRVLEREWTTLVRMTFQTRFLISKCLIDHRRSGGHSPGRRESSMRIVAIRTAHEALVNRMLEWHGKLRTNIDVTAIAEIGLTLGQ